LFDGGLGELRDVSRETELHASGLPYTLLRVTSVRDAPGGGSALQLLPLAGRLLACVGVYLHACC
jgi:hypothetical protein